MIVHDTSLKACATYKCLGVEECRGEYGGWAKPMDDNGRL